MAKINCTRQDVIEAISECALMGTDLFLDFHGYQASTRYQLRYGGRSYPSKAILGVAAGLKPGQFFGGVAQTVPALQKLGFEIRDGQRVVTSVAWKAIAEQAGVEPLAWPELPADPSCYFASGSNSPGEIDGLAMVGHDIGVAVNQLSERAIEKLEKLAGSDVQVFADSGAFSEIKFGPAGPVVVKPITADDWMDRLGVYRRLGEALGSQLWIVAPDRVGDQDETLRRLRAYREELGGLRSLGVRILLPVQKGQRSQAEFYREACIILGFAPIPALPCKKAATTAEEAAEFVRATEPSHVHLLGLGIRNRQVGAYIEAMGCASFSLDSNWITANVGRKNGVRRYTAARDIASRMVSTVAEVAGVAMLIAHGLAGVLSGETGNARQLTLF